MNSYRTVTAQLTCADKPTDRRGRHNPYRGDAEVQLSGPSSCLPSLAGGLLLSGAGKKKPAHDNTVVAGSTKRSPQSRVARQRDASVGMTLTGHRQPLVAATLSGTAAHSIHGTSATHIRRQSLAQISSRL
jgi:hypothetical protein